MAPFTLSPFKEEDFAELVAMEYKTFTDSRIQDTFMGPDTPEGREQLRLKYIKTSKEDPHDYWIKIVDKSSGKMIAASNWKICQSTIPDHLEDISYPYLQEHPDRLKVALAVQSDIMCTRKRLYREPYVQLYICMTDPDFERRGAGSMMMKWGTQLADLLYLPMWIEASKAGALLYQKYGFEQHETRGEERGMLMYRPARGTVIEGGKEKEA
ncbi:hypothetical protein CAC42_3528 [Sphaceloma murrayae]|uniref:N-acetyltransferase domain-containing protein n=1 Tax=Sphaceloma murrayae TaxID=2082308 RepID=A0A2K1R1R4_9PEZI|nr:hypothetical protein CAC42_3528 [Sphaceloma murrayae]